MTKDESERNFGIWKSCNNPDYEDEIRPCYKCGIMTRFCKNCGIDHHIENLK